MNPIYNPILPSLLENKETRIVITTHHKPDGDAMGSTLGLYNFLIKLGLKPAVITPTDYASFLNWLPQNDTVLNFEEFPQKCKTLIEQAEWVFCLDFNKLTRINDMGQLVSLSGAKCILVDHHQEPDTFFDNQWWDPKASSTCELIYRFIVKEGYESLIDKNIAVCLYTGLVTDTGSFRYRGTNANTLRIAANLLEIGVDQSEIYDRVFDSFTEKRLKLIGFAISERMEILQNLNTAIIWLSAEDLKKFDVKTGDTEGLVNYGLAVQGVKLAILVIDRTVLVKMSFRSKGTLNVNEIAKKHFEGGGHINASGGSSSLSLEETIKKIKSILPLYSKELSNE